jgi:mutator protein MutT
VSIESLPTIHVVGALVRRGSLVLVTKRRTHAVFGGYWEFPGGKVEPGETAAEALARELREELAVRARVGKLFQSVEMEYPTFIIRLEVMEVDIVGEPVAIGVDEVAWVAARDLNQKQFPPADLPIAERLVREAMEHEPLN